MICLRGVIYRKPENIVFFNKSRGITRTKQVFLDKV